MRMLCLLPARRPTFVGAQQPAAAKPPLRSPVVHDDGRVTLAQKAPQATAAALSSGEFSRLFGEGK